MRGGRGNAVVFITGPRRWNMKLTASDSHRQGSCKQDLNIISQLVEVFQAFISLGASFYKAEGRKYAHLLITLITVYMTHSYDSDKSSHPA